MDQQPKAAPRKTIVICDDNDDILEVFALCLRSENYTVRVAHNYQELLPLLRHPKPDLLILDIRMPDMDGFDILEAIAAEGLHPPVFMMTAHDHFMYRNYAPVVGVREYLTKPVDADVLLQKIKSTIG